MTIATEKVGARIYVVGNTYSVKDKLKAAGCHWDGDRKQWWIGAAKAADIAGIVDVLATAPAPAVSVATPADTSTIRLVGKAKYKGKSYYVRWVGLCKSGDYKCHLITLDGSIDFWAKCAQPHEFQVDGNGDVARIVKTYQVREYRGREEYTTLGSIRRFIEQRKQDDTAVDNGEIPAGWCVDLEDGCVKPRSECDMPSN